MGSRFRSIFIAALLLFTFSGAGAQLPPPPAPDAVPSYYVPPEYASLVRGEAVTVNTTADENDLSCATISIREAFLYCPADTVYIPEGRYELTQDEIPVVTYPVTIVGEGVELTTIVATPGRHIFGFDVNGAVAILNIRFERGVDDNTNSGIIYAGSGSLAVVNVEFSGFHAPGAGAGGAISIETDGGAMAATIDGVNFSSNTAGTDGGAISFTSDDGNGSSLHIDDSEFRFNQAGTTGCAGGGGAVAFSMEAGVSGTLDIDDSIFNFNSTAGGCGGAIGVFDADGGSTVSIERTTFGSNEAAFGNGGALYVSNPAGTLSITEATLGQNAAVLGGAVFDLNSRQLTIDSSTFLRNNASDSGGAVEAFFTAAVTITRSTFTGNTAATAGGALDLYGDQTYIADTMITNNFAGNPGGGTAGGVRFYGSGATLLRTLIEDNSAAASPDCEDLYLGGTDFPVQSLGGVGMTNASGCNFFAAPGDQYDNLLVNGGFEAAGATASKPEWWTLKKPTGDKRVCNTTGSKPVTPYGGCAFLFTGGAAGVSLSQSVDPNLYPMIAGDLLTLYAMGDGVKGSKVSLTLTVTYTGQPALKRKLTLGNSVDYTGLTGAPLTLTGVPTAISVKITDASKKGKFYLDRVYLMWTLVFGRRAPAAEGGLLPPPSAPSGMRGGN